MPSPATEADFAMVELLILDMDGVLTDGGVWYGANGDLFKRFAIIDGMGIVLAQRAGVAVAIMTSENTSIAKRRAEVLKIRHYHAGVMDKGKHLPLLLKEAGVDAANTAYIGDDINDATALKAVGLSIATPEAQAEIKTIARYVTVAPGGNGAVREVVNRIIRAKGLDPVALWEQGE